MAKENKRRYNREYNKTPKALEASSIRTLKNKEHLREVKRNYYQKNKVKMAEQIKLNRKPKIVKAHNESTWKYVKNDECDICGSASEKLETHHWNYDKPLMVNTLCRTCHKIQHIKNFERWLKCKLIADANINKPQEVII